MKQLSLTDVASMMRSSIADERKISGVSVDSRLTRSGDLFFALPGQQVDGHAFLEEAAKAGAIAAVVQKNYQKCHIGLSLIYVEDVLFSLQLLAKTILEKRQASIIAVTGSLGKTTTKEFVTELLKSKYKVAVSPGNSNSQIGLPLAIINHTSDDDEIIVLEMGMTLPGHLSKLIEIAPPDVAVITTVALVHAEGFESLEGIAQAKAEIFGHPRTKLGIYHLESDLNQAITQVGTCIKRSFSTTDSQADYFLSMSEDHLHIKGEEGSTVDLPLLNLPGAHNRHNFLAAIAVARCFGISWDEIKHKQATLFLPERRLQIVEKQGICFINDAYNASEPSMKAALDSLPNPKLGNKKIAFLGGMVELGKFSQRCHQAVGKYALDHVDLMLCFGNDCLVIFEEWKLAKRPVVWAKDRDELVSTLKELVNPGDVVLLKGSRSKGVWKVLDEFV
jgi:UDP-N-acetylmuramoyl-tripeptide--D-alanyl-D-alanine ligase